MKIVCVADDGTQTDVTEAVQVAYDCVVSSLDWGSGFLDAQEMQTVLDLAHAAGFYFADKAYEAQKYHRVKLSGPFALAAAEVEARHEDRQRERRRINALFKTLDDYADAARVLGWDL